jgi:hypothetical protein
VTRAGSFLDRFRRLVAPPGRPSEAVGVPASGEDLEAELAPLLADVDNIDAQAERIDADAHSAAAHIREQAEREAAAILEAAAGSADAERVRAAAERGAQAQRDVALVREQSRAEAARIRGRRDEAVAELVAEVLECVRRTGR